MSSQTVRSLLAEVAIGVALCAAAYMMIVEPIDRALVIERAKEAALRKEAAAEQSLSAQAASLRAQIASVQAWARRVRAAGALTDDEAGMLGAVMEHAGRHRVHVEEINPRPAREAAKPDSGPLKRTRRTAYSIRLESTFPDLVAFIDTAPDALGFMRIESLTISTPSKPGSETVHVTMQTEHLGFDVSAILTDASSPKVEKGAP